MDRPTDPAELLTRARRGERQAFEELLLAERQAVQRHVEIRLGNHVRGCVDAEDVLQETFTRAFEALPRLEWRGERAFRGWLKSIAEKVTLERARRARRDGVLYLEDEVAAEAVSPSKALRREERFARLEKALEGLSPEYRQVILLSRIDGLGVREIARRMDSTPKAVSHLLSRALGKLKDAFGDTESLHLPDRRLTPPGEHNGD